MRAAVEVVVSTKGQVIMPSAIRSARKWAAGTRLEVVETAEGVLFKDAKPKRPRPPTRLEDVIGMLKYDGPPVTIEQMNDAVLEEAARQYAGESAYESD